MFDSFIQWFLDRKGKVTYSMDNRNGPDSYDCSSAVYHALIGAGLLPSMRIGNTDTLFGDLERNGWIKVSGPRQRGDVFIWGKRGASGGAAGHTGAFADSDNIVHCAYGYNGIAFTNHDWLWRLNGSPEVTIYRYVGGAATPAMNTDDQIIDPGSFIKYDKTFRADDVQLVGGVWQVRTNELCKNGFTWEDNGIPVSPLVEVDAEGYATPDQELDIGSLYKIPGKFYVYDVGQNEGAWLAQIEAAGLKFWVDIETATEVSTSDSGTPTPGQRPAPVSSTPATPVENQPTPVTSAPPVDDVSPVIQEPEPVSEKPVSDTPQEQIKPKEKTMAFSEEEQKQLKIATDRVQATADAIAASDGVSELTDTISKKTKTIVYLVGDTLVGLGLVTLGVAVVLDIHDVIRVAALSSVFTTAGTFILVMFGIYKSNK